MGYWEPWYSFIIYCRLKYWEAIGSFTFFSCFLKPAWYAWLTVGNIELSTSLMVSFASSPKPDALPSCATPRSRFYIDNTIVFQSRKKRKWYETITLVGSFGRLLGALKFLHAPWILGFYPWDICLGSLWELYHAEPVSFLFFLKQRKKETERER